MRALFDVAFILTLVSLIVINFRTMLLPNAITYPGFLVSVVAHSLLMRTQPFVLEFFQRAVASPVLASLLDSLLGAIITGGALLLLNSVWKRARGTEVVGYGDVKMAAMIGAYLGIINGVGVLILSTILIAASTAVLSALRRADSPIPSGSFWGLPAILLTVVSSPALAGLFAGGN